MDGAAVTSTAGAADRDDIQGIAAFAYGKLTQACYILARIKDSAAARAWCAAAPVSASTPLPNPPETAMQLAFTADGLRALGIAEAVLAGFPNEFLFGIAGDENRSRRLGDTGANHPRNWLWGRPDRNLHIAVLLYAKDSLEPWKRAVLGEHWEAAFETIACLDTSNMGDQEPFGFRDGISQPEVDWPGERVVGGDEVSYSNVVSLGEFVLGYPNEYGKYTDRPLVRPQDDPADDLLPALDDPASKDLARNGTYLVLRQLEQDVRGFWQFLDRAAKGDAETRYQLGAAMVGRTRTGEPLMPDTGAAIAGVLDEAGHPRNRFVYDGDPRGAQCPLGAHIRRANPRSTDLPGHPDGPIAKLLKRVGIPRAQFGEDLIASTRFHRILRRGREYGIKLDPEAALEPGQPGELPRGLHFACINANIVRQFEFVQNAWLMSAKFGGLTDESDPLLGNREVGHRQAAGDCPVANYFSIQREGLLARRIQRVPQFITVRGGAYFFLPGQRARRWLTRG
jgi:deferrochelatase/peroxidase EfeB